jgi:hypothetical protein
MLCVLAIVAVEAMGLTDADTVISQPGHKAAVKAVSDLGYGDENITD